MRPEVRNCPGRGAGRGIPRREGPPTAAGRWQGQLPSPGKAAPEPNTPVSANSSSPRAGARAHAPPTPRHCPPSGVKPSHAAKPGSQGWTFSHKSRSKQLAGAKQEEVHPGRKFRCLEPSPFSLNYSLNCYVLFGPGCLFETGISSRAGAHFL